MMTNCNFTMNIMIIYLSDKIYNKCLSKLFILSKFEEKICQHLQTIINITDKGILNSLNTEKLLQRNFFF